MYSSPLAADYMLLSLMFLVFFHQHLKKKDGIKDYKWGRLSSYYESSLILQKPTVHQGWPGHNVQFWNGSTAAAQWILEEACFCSGQLPDVKINEAEHEGKRTSSVI